MSEKPLMPPATVPNGTGSPYLDAQIQLQQQLASIVANSQSNFSELYSGAGGGGGGGNVLRNGSGAPSNSLGIDGDFYIDSTAHNLYGPRAGGVWPSGVAIVGPQGNAGTNGTNGSAGSNGNTVNHGTGVPSSGLGSNGDFYIDTAANNLYGPKSAGAWGSGVSMVGPAGSGGSSSPMVASGASHAGGTVPDPGATVGSYRFLREDATWVSTNAINGTAGTIRNIATRCRHDQQYYTGANLVSCAGRSVHVNMGNGVYGPQIVLGNWIASSAGEIVPAGGAITEMVSIEYPAGHYTMASWDTANSSSIRTESINIPAGGTDVISDPIPVFIPAGHTFWVRRFSYFTSGTAAQFPVSMTAVGAGTDTLFNGYTVAPSTGTLIDPRAFLVGSTLPTGTTAMAQMRYPLAILGLSNVASALVIGDSRCSGYNDGDLLTIAANPVNTIGEADWGRWGMGEVCRSLGYSRPYTNMGIPSDAAHQYVTLGNTFRNRQATYHTDVIVQLGINDVKQDSRTGAAAFSDLQTIWAYFPTKRVWQCTIAPVATSSDGYATVINQTTDASNAQRVALNTSIRAIPSPLAGIFDNAAAMESSLNSGLWNIVAGLGAPCEVSGVHETPTYYKYLSMTKSVDPSRLTSI